MRFLGKDKTFNNFLTGLITFLLVLICPLYSSADTSNKISPDLVKAFSSQGSQDLIILLDDSAVQSDLQFKVSRSSGLYRSKDIASMKAAGFRSLKQNIMTAFSTAEVETAKDYKNLPMLFVKVKSSDALQKLIDSQKIVRIFPDEKHLPLLTESLELIHQSSAADLGLTGTGTTVAVLDTGGNFTLGDFGPCSAPDTPLGTCKVVFAQDFTTIDDGTRDDADVPHGTNVAGIVLGVAPDTQIAALDVFTKDEIFGLYALTSDIIEAIDWCIENKTAYNIVAMNLSLGMSVKYKMPCSNDALEIPFKEAKDIGILAAVASGNDGWTDGIGTPACAPSAVSVGAVYDSDVGVMHWGICNDNATSPDKVTCFSNSSPHLTLLAPGSVIESADETMSGTSQATPHVAGAVAVLKGEGGYPEYTVDQVVSLLTSTGFPVIDHRNGITKPRVDLRRMIITSPLTLFAYTNNINETGTGSGSIMSNPAGIDCGGDCEYDFDLNTKIKLQATADEYSTFRGWSGDCSGTKPSCNLTMSNVKEVYALFEWPDLSGSFMSISRQQKKSVFSLSALLAVYTGAGNSSNVTVNFYLSDDSIYDGEDTLISTSIIKSIKLDSSRTVKLNYTSPVSPAGKYLIALIDPANEITESEDGNNTVTAYIP